MRRHNTPNPRKARKKLQRLYLAVALLLVTAVGTFTWTSTTLAKYVTSATFSDSARVARFVVNIGDVAADRNLTLDTTNNILRYRFVVTNHNESKVCEVATVFDVIVTLPSALSGITMELIDTEPKSLPYTVSADGLTYTFKEACVLQPGSNDSENLALAFTLTESPATDLSWENIKVDLIAYQVN